MGLSVSFGPECLFLGKQKYSECLFLGSPESVPRNLCGWILEVNKQLILAVFFANGYVLEDVLVSILFWIASYLACRVPDISLAARYPRPEMGLWAHLRASDPFWGRKTPLNLYFLLRNT